MAADDVAAAVDAVDSAAGGVAADVWLVAAAAAAAGVDAGWPTGAGVETA